MILTPLTSCEESPSDDTTVEDEDEKDLPPIGNQIGKRCISTDLELVLDDGTVNIKDYVGKIVVINFWGTWCAPCKSELPHFDEVADEYSDSVVILTVHSIDGVENAPAYVEQNHSNSKMIFAKDKSGDGYYKALNPGIRSYPVTIVLDKDGVITYKAVGAISKTTLVSEIEKAK